MPNIHKNIDPSIPRTKEMVLAEPTDLFIGKVIYVVTVAHNERVYEQQIRGRVKKSNRWSEDETDEQYQDYRDMISAFIRDKKLLIIKENGTSRT